jgi:hypothetical protein
LASIRIGVHPRLLRVSDEDNSIDTFEDELSAGVVEDLAGNGVEVKTSFESANGAEIER